VAASLFSIVLVPLTIEFLGRLFHQEAHIAPAVIGKVILITVLVPLLAGLVVRHFVPGVAERIAKWVSLLGSMLLVAGILPIFVAAWPGIVSLIGNGTILAIGALIVVGLIAGHLLGGPDPGDRIALAFASSMRHPGVAMAIASVNSPGQKLVPAAVLLFLVVNAIVTLPYAAWCKRRHVEVAAVEPGGRA
jgi:BASS family bile acid:Na+ symporter